MAISLRRLRYFQAIGTYGSLSATARALHVAQPALSHHIQELEDEFGTKLLIRSNKGIELTASGETLLRHANDILQRVEDADNEIRSLVKVPHGEVSIALAATMARHIVPNLLKELGERYPQVRVNIHSGNSEKCKILLESNAVHIALVPNAAEIANIEARALYRECLCLIEKSQGKTPNCSPIAFHEIGARPLVLTSKKTNVRRRVEEASIETDHPLNTVYEEGAPDITLAIVLSGLAATLTQASFVHPISIKADLDCREIVNPSILITHSIVTPVDQSVSLAVTAVKSLIGEIIISLVKNKALAGAICDDWQ